MEISSIISLLSMIVTLIMGTITLIVMIHPNKYSPRITSRVEKDCSEISIIIVNNGLRPINIKSFIVGYGQIQSDLQIILVEKLKKPIKIMDGEEYEHHISRNKIIESTKMSSIKQYYSQRLWTGIKLTNGKTLIKRTEISPSIIKGNYLPNAVDFISADVFIGFEQMESKMFIPIIAK
jgi:hypothetical protein